MDFTNIAEDFRRMKCKSKRKKVLHNMRKDKNMIMGKKIRHDKKKFRMTSWRFVQIKSSI